jgi:hypothetical protein
LSEAAENTPWPPFRITLALTEAEMLTYLKMVQSRQRARSVRRGYWVVAASFALALLGGWLMVQGGIVHAADEGLVSVILFALYWIGLYTSLAWLRRDARRQLRDAHAEIRGRWVDARLLVSPRGIFIRTGDVRVFYRRSAIKAATQERGLIVLWLIPETARSIAFIPVRLLQPGEAEKLLAFGAGQSGTR